MIQTHLKGIHPDNKKATAISTKCDVPAVWSVQFKYSGVSSRIKPGPFECIAPEITILIYILNAAKCLEVN